MKNYSIELDLSTINSRQFQNLKVDSKSERRNKKRRVQTTSRKMFNAENYL